MEKINKIFNDLKNQCINDLQLKIIFLHSINLTYMQCVGLLENDIESNEQLPNNWQNHQDGVYSFKYKCQNDIIYFKLIHEGNLLDINCVNKNKSDQLLQFQVEIDKQNDENLYLEYKKKIIDQIIPKKKDLFSQPNSIFNQQHNPLYSNPPQVSPQFMNPQFNNPQIFPNIRVDPVGPFSPDNDIDPWFQPNRNENPFQQPQQNQPMFIGGPNDLNPLQNRNNNPFNNPLNRPGQGGFGGGFGGGFNGGFPF